jgi:hypothetical protein
MIKPEQLIGQKEVKAVLELASLLDEVLKTVDQVKEEDYLGTNETEIDNVINHCSRFWL